MKIEDDLRDLFARQAQSMTSASEAWIEVSQRTRRSGRMQRVGAISLALSISAAATAGLIWAYSSDSSDGNDLAAPEVVTASVVATIAVAEDAAGLAVSSDRAWVGVPGPDCSGEVAVVDATSHSVSLRIPLDFSPQALVVANDSVWVSGYRCSGPTSGDGTVRFEAVVARLDSVNGNVDEVVPLPGNEVTGTVASEGIWVGVRADAPSDDRLIRIDATDLRVTTDMSVPGVGQLVASGERIWVQSAGQDPPGIVRIDVSTGEAYFLPVGSLPAFTVSDGTIWTSGPLSEEQNDIAAIRFDGATGQPVGKPYSLAGSPFLPFGADPGGVWFIAQRGPMAGVARLASVDGETDAFVAVADHASLEAIYDGAASTVWVLDQPNGVLTKIAVHRS